MITVNKKQVALIDGKLVGEASMMGIEPGYVPDFIGILDDNNEGYMFGYPQPDMHNGEIAGWNYTGTMSAIKLLVIND